MDHRPGAPDDTLMPVPSISGHALPPAQLDWQNDQPRSRTYDDIYHSADGVAECQRVFIEPAQLVARWQQQQDFTVAELGFGTGLNLAVLVDLWQRAPGTRLHFISFEQSPLHTRDWQRVCNQRQARMPAYRLLQDHYPPLISGWHQRRLLGGAVTVHLFFGSAETGLTDCAQQPMQPVDAWWLDGFAPAKNPALWTPELLARLPALSRPGTSVTTFTAAGRVRRALENAGFAMRYVDQQPFKRESLAGVLQDQRAATTASPAADSALTEAQQLARTAPIQIVGAGIAGATLARRLAESGRHCIVFDAAARPLGASSLPRAVVHGRLLGDQSPAAALRVHAALLASAELRHWPQWQPGGVMQCATQGDESNKLTNVARIYADSGDWCIPAEPLQLQQALGGWLPETAHGLWFPHCGQLNPLTLIGWLLAHPNIEQRWQQPITGRMPYEGIRVYANGSGVASEPAARFLELSGLTGQVELARHAQPPTVPLVGAGYVVPYIDSEQCPGAMTGGNYEYRPWSPQRATAHNLRSAPSGHRWQARWRGLRVTSSDRAPVAGLLIRKDHSAIVNRWVSVGHGSQGMTSSHLSAAAITNALTGQPPALAQDLLAQLAPLRFRERQDRRGYRFGASG